jgi:hypothetical protein
MPCLLIQSQLVHVLLIAIAYAFFSQAASLDPCAGCIVVAWLTAPHV